MSIKPENPVSDVQSHQYLAFILGGEEYAVDILKVQEIRSWDAATHIPNAPEYVLGVMNLRGIVVPIIDLRLRFNLEKFEYSPTTVNIIVKVNKDNVERTVGMVVDAVSDVYIVQNDYMKAAPDFGGALSTEYVTGLATVEDKMVIVLDVDLLINTGVLGFDNKTESAIAVNEVSSEIN